MNGGGKVRRVSICLLGALALVSTGCGGVFAKRVGAPEIFQAWRVSASADESVSPRTLQTLRTWDLESVYLYRPDEAFARLQAIAEKTPRPDVLFALAEIAYLLGRGNEDCACNQAVGYYYLCAGYAYHYLFGPGVVDRGSWIVDRKDRGTDGSCLLDPRSTIHDPCLRASPFDPRFRLACDLYNAGLAKCIRAAQRVGRLDPRHALRLPTCDKLGFTLSVVHHGFLWKPKEFGPLLLCEDYRSVGLANEHRTYGLGVPLIAVRAADAPDPGHRFYPPGVSFPATAFFRFDGTLADLRNQRAGRLELYNPLAVQAIEVAGVTAPLETDLTTPLAYFLGQIDLEKIGLTGFLSPDAVQGLSGIYMLEPYQPGKVPVLMVHGLLSSPLTWATLFNDLRADPGLRERYQFWFFLYPTANPYLTSAADLRQALARVRATFDPEGRDAALNDMVLVGHSMGGLVSKLMTLDSGDDFWRLVSDGPFEGLQASPQTREALRRTFFFERQSCVKRVVFLGTPHRGSKLSPSLPARIARRFMRMPKGLVTAARDLAEMNPNFLDGPRPDAVPTSLDLLAPGAPALAVLAARTRPAGVYYHSIIGVAPPTAPVRVAKFLAGAEKCEPGDGVVPYASAHLDDVNSEVVVPADHTQVQHHPLAVAEVRRILLEHLRATGRLTPR